MEDWTNTCIIPCVGRSGETVTVIEQSRADRIQRTLSFDEDDRMWQRYVLGNGRKVEPLDMDRFVVSDTQEIVTRQ